MDGESGKLRSDFLIGDSPEDCPLFPSGEDLKKPIIVHVTTKLGTCIKLAVSHTMYR